jgi:hypothetical protein
MPILSIHRSGKIVFNILARSQHRLLLSRLHVVGTYLRIQVYVNFVLVQCHLVRRQCFNQPFYKPNTPFAGLL